MRNKKPFVDFAKTQCLRFYGDKENGLVERVNQELLICLTAIIADEDVGEKFQHFVSFVYSTNNQFTS